MKVIRYFNVCILTLFFTGCSDPDIGRFAAWDYNHLGATACPTMKGILKAVRNEYSKGCKKRLGDSFVGNEYPTSGTIVLIHDKAGSILYEIKTKSGMYFVEKKFLDIAKIQADAEKTIQAKLDKLSLSNKNIGKIGVWDYKNLNAITCDTYSGIRNALTKYIYDGCITSKLAKPDNEVSGKIKSVKLSPFHEIYEVETSNGNIYISHLDIAIAENNISAKFKLREKQEKMEKHYKNTTTTATTYTNSTSLSQTQTNSNTNTDFTHIIKGPAFACTEKIHWRTFMNYMDKGNMTGISLMNSRGQCYAIPKGQVLPVTLIDEGNVGFEPVATLKTPKGNMAYTTPNAVELRP